MRKNQEFFRTLLDGSANIDPDKAARTAMNGGGNTGNNLGSVQVDDFKTHLHSFYTTGANDGAFNMRAAAENANNGTTQNTEHRTVATGGTETRPVNAYVNYIVKF